VGIPNGSHAAAKQRNLAVFNDRNEFSATAISHPAAYFHKYKINFLGDEKSNTWIPCGLEHEFLINYVSWRYNLTEFYGQGNKRSSHSHANFCIIQVQAEDSDLSAICALS